MSQVAACRQVGWGGVGWGGVGLTCDNVEAVGCIQDLLQPDHVGVLRQHAHDSHLLHDILYHMLRRFLSSSSVALCRLAPYSTFFDCLLWSA